jgi:UDP-N-acetyl-D-mannosaminuronate dehydrogenase
MPPVLKIAIAGTGYVGLSNAVLLAQHHEVVAIDIVAAKVDQLNARQSPIEDTELEHYLATRTAEPARHAGHGRRLHRRPLRHHRHPHQLRPRHQLL